MIFRSISAKKTFTKIMALLLMLAGICTFAGCGMYHSAADPVLGNCGIEYYEQFGDVFITSSIDDFNALGFQYGDSVDIEFSNGYSLEDIPYYNGYYTAAGEPLLVGYPGGQYIKVSLNNGDDLWETAGLAKNMTATVTLDSAGKYKKTQDARNISYEDDRQLFSSDEEFANFRSIQTDSMRDNTVYRSASPCDNRRNRAAYVDDLIDEAGVLFILDLSDNDEMIREYMGSDDFDSPYFAGLYEAGAVTPIAIGYSYTSQEFKEKIAQGLKAMSEHEGPYLVHCTEGKDRTGFVCMLLEALTGAGYDEIEADYMITYNNYYGITKETDADRYDVIVEDLLVPMIEGITGDGVDVTNAPLSGYAENYLLGAGMSREEIDRLRTNLQ